MNFLPTVSEVSGGFSWIKQHPFTAAVAAVAATALSLAQYAYDEQVAERKKFIKKLTTEGSELERCISWSDEKGGELAQIIDHEYAGSQSVRSEDDVCVHSLPQSDVAEENDDSEDDESESEFASGYKSPISPQWGWWVSITPPRNNMYEPAKASSSSSSPDAQAS